MKTRCSTIDKKPEERPNAPLPARHGLTLFIAGSQKYVDSRGGTGFVPPPPPLPPENSKTAGWIAAKKERLTRRKLSEST